MRFLLLMVGVIWFATGSTAHADCSNPAAVEGTQDYNATAKEMQFCDGTNWHSMKGGNGSLPVCSDGDTLIAVGNSWVCSGSVLCGADAVTENNGTNIVYCEWSSALTWDAAAAKAPDGWRICKASEFKSRYATLSAFAKNGYLWGRGRNLYWGESYSDTSSYACVQPSGTCHANEHGYAIGYPAGQVGGRGECANGSFTSASYCNYAMYDSVFFCPQ